VRETCSPDRLQVAGKGSTGARLPDPKSQTNQRPALVLGDSTSGMLVGRLASVPVIGYADKPGKAELLTHAGADTVTTGLDELTRALRLTPVAKVVDAACDLALCRVSGRWRARDGLLITDGFDRWATLPSGLVP
jgi:hypothetical protein